MSTKAWSIHRLRGIYTDTGAVIETYRYDGLGRRVQSRSPTGQTVRSQYARDGKLVFQYDQLTSERVAYLYLGNRLVATRTRPLSAPVYTIEYQHTDPLGSPVAKSDANGVVQRRDDYEPYGKRINRANDNRPGFTGHVVDGATGLIYMQQRYYDPRIGRFWSVDPVTAFSSPGSNFNRYAYANNNPYKFTDPDGRYSCEKATCGKVRKIVRAVRKARDNAKRGSDDRRRLDAVVRHIGTENGKGPHFVSAELEEGTAAKADQKGTIKIDFKKLEGRSDASIEGGRSVTHEVKHDLDAQGKGVATTESAVRAREVEAYKSENSFLRQNGMEMTEGAMQDGIDKSVEQWRKRQP